jgi:hypothetical protein
VFSGGFNSTITVGNGNDTIHVGKSDSVTVGTGQDSFVFDASSQNAQFGIGFVTINGFNPSKDVIKLQSFFYTSYQVSDDGQGNAKISFSSAPFDTITLVGVHASDLHASDFQLV